MRYRAWFAASAWIGSCLAGCAAPEAAVPSPDDVTAGDDASRMVWPYWPTRLRIHPLTRLVTDADGGRPVIEARIEMFDQHGHTTKACGRLVLELTSADSPASSEPAAVWELDLTDLEINRLRYDDVTRTYLFPLETDADRLPENPVLRAYFLSANGLLFRRESRALPKP